MGFGGGGGGGLGLGMGGGLAHGGFGAESERRKRTVSDMSLLRRLLVYARPYKRQLVILFISLISGSICNMIVPTLHKIAIDQIIHANDFMGFMWWAPLFVSTIVVNFVAQYLQQYMTAYVGENIISSLRADMVKRLQILSLRYFAEGETGRVMSRVTNDAEAVRNFFRMGAVTIVTDVVTIVRTCS